MATSRLTGWLVILLLVGLVAGCGRGREVAEADQPLIVASIFPLASLTDYLVDNFARVETLLPPGTSPHGFEMTPRQMRLLSEADVLVVVGMGLDPWAERAARQVGKEGLQIYRFADMIAEPGEAQTSEGENGEGIEPTDAASAGAVSGNGGEIGGGHSHDHLPHIDHDHHGHDCHDHGGPNPHLWLDPILVDRFVAQLSVKLGPMFEHVGQSLRMRANMFRHDIFKIDVDYRHRMDRLSNRRLVTFHNAFDLLAHRYDLEVVAHLTEIELAPGGEVTPRQLRQAIDAVQRYNLKAIYAEPQFPEQAMHAIRQQTGVRVLRLDPLGHPDVPGYQNWVQMMRSNLEVLAEGQSLD